jgi:hypothetical membrane protein
MASPVKTPWKPWRLLLWAGLIGPVLFTLVFTVDGFLKPGYSAVQEAVSYLEVGAYGWVQVANFTAVGLLLAVFALGLARSVPVMGARSRYAAAGFIALSALGYVIAAIFPPAAFGEPQNAPHSVMHSIAFSTVFCGQGIACLIIGGNLVRTAWRGHGWYSVAVGVLVLVIAVANAVSVVTVGQTPASNPSAALKYGGVFNRVVIVIAFAWFVVIAIRLIRQDQEMSAESSC